MFLVLVDMPRWVGIPWRPPLFREEREDERRKGGEGREREGEDVIWRLRCEVNKLINKNTKKRRYMTVNMDLCKWRDRKKTEDIFKVRGI